MSGIFSLRSPSFRSILKSSTTYSAPSNITPRISRFSKKWTTCVVCVMPQSSGYHTNSQIQPRLLQKHHHLIHLATKPSYRNSSIFSNFLHKTFVLKAAEPLPNDSLADPLSPISGTIDQSVWDSSKVTADHSPIQEQFVATTSNIQEATTDVNYTALSESLSTETALDSITYIPPPPAPPEVISGPLNALGEPTLQSLGLGGWSPVGIIQNCLDFLHVSGDLPWWGAIAIATVCIRIIVFPLVIASHRNSAHMMNHAPQMEIIQMKMTEARNAGNQMETARLSHELMIFLEEKKINPAKMAMLPFAQAPIFISMFFGLREMANLPMESMKTGGLYWFTDLTLADPYCILPLITATTMSLTLELGADGAKINTSTMKNMKWVMRALPIVVFPFTINFPAAGWIGNIWNSSSFAWHYDVRFHLGFEH